MPIKSLNESDAKSLLEMKERIQGMRHQIGLLDEQIVEAEAQKEQVRAAVQKQKQAFRERVQALANSNDVDLASVKDGTAWHFDEANMAFVSVAVQPKS